MGKSYYLDYAASTPVKKEVLEFFNLIAKNFYANPSSNHQMGVLSMEIVYDSKERIANAINCSPAEIYFTSGATMSNSVAIQGFLRRGGLNAFLCSAVEHDDIMLVADYMHGNVRGNYMLDVDRNGILKLDELDSQLKRLSALNFSTLVSVQMANSESGVIQPIKEISEIIHKYPDCYLHTDATQYLPYYNIDVQELGIDLMSMSGQKLGGIKGSGFLFVRDGIKLIPVIFGEQGLIGGTYATPLVASLAEATCLSKPDNQVLKAHRDYMLDKLERMGGNLVGDRNHRLPNNIYIRFDGVRGDTLMRLLSEHNICISTGSACSSGSDEPSHVALAYGLSEQQAMECVRFTIGETITEKDIDYICYVIENVLMLLR